VFHRAIYFAAIFFSASTIFFRILPILVISS